MMRVLCGTVLALAVAMLPAAAAAAGPSQRPLATGMGSGTVVIPVTAGVFRLTLVIGPMEPMYTQAQFKRLHPKHGEIMLRGAMMMGGTGMGMHMPNRHLDLHVLDRRTMRPVANATVSITYQPIVPMGVMAIRPQQVPVAVMVGIGMGMNDVHYGNNVYMARGAYHVWAHVATRTARAYATYTVRL